MTTSDGGSQIYDFILREWPIEADVLPAIGEDVELEIDADMREASDTLLSMRSDPIYAFDPSVFDNTETCAQCGCVFNTESLTYRQSYDTCADCGIGICPSCFELDPCPNGKMCSCCGTWLCSEHIEAHESEFWLLE
jgi:hypothetical protein